MTEATQAYDPMQGSQTTEHAADGTRAGLVEKLETLEHRVVGMVQGATGSVTETIDSVKETVGHSVEAVQEAVRDTVQSVRHALDVRHHVRQHPWLLLGAAVALGFGCGRFLGRR